MFLSSWRINTTKTLSVKYVVLGGDILNTIGCIAKGVVMPTLQMSTER
jgi:hypothetical protein